MLSRRALIYIGEPEGATGSVRFHRELALNWTLEEEVRLPNWPKLRDIRSSASAGV